MLEGILESVNSGLRRSAVNSIKRGNFFLLYGRSVKVTGLSTSDNFSPYNRAMICINDSLFLRIFKKLAVQHERNVRSLAD